MARNSLGPRRHRVEALPPPSRDAVPSFSISDGTTSVRESGAAMVVFSGAGVPFGLVIALVSLAVVACNRTPPEPAPTQSPTLASAVKTTPEPASAKSAGAPSRCISPMAPAAPALPKAAEGSRCPPDPEPNEKMPTAEVAFPETPGTPKVEAELAKSAHDVERGLMFRRTMKEDHGMLFKLDGRREHTFWMHNTCLPLDMMFIDEDGVIVGIVEGAEPLTDTTRSVGCPSLYVLEMNAGWSRKRGVVPGQKITIPSSAR
jgi:uncharacterized protein